MTSVHGKLNSADWQRIGRNALIFTIPVITTWLGIFTNGITDWKVYAVAGAVWLQGVLLDVARKWNAGK